MGRRQLETLNWRNIASITLTTQRNATLGEAPGGVVGVDAFYYNNKLASDPAPCVSQKQVLVENRKRSKRCRRFNQFCSGRRRRFLEKTTCADQRPWRCAGNLCRAEPLSHWFYGEDFGRPIAPKLHVFHTLKRSFRIIVIQEPVAM